MHIRPATTADAAAIQAIYAPFVSETPVSFEEDVPSVEEMAHRIQQVQLKLPWLVCEEEGELLGYAYATPHRARAAYRWSVDVTVYTGPKARRKGVGRSLYTELLRQLTELGYFNAFAGITLPNDASVGLHEAMGFERIATYRNVGFKCGRWHDTGWWQKTLRESTVAPNELLKLSGT